MSDHHHDEEKMILDHEPVQGYLPAFLIIFTLGILYLAWILFDTL